MAEAGNLVFLIRAMGAVIIQTEADRNTLHIQRLGENLHEAALLTVASLLFSVSKGISIINCTCPRSTLTGTKVLNQFKLFDSHFHVIDGRFPLVPNKGYIPEEFTCEDYLERTSTYDLCGGAIVSGSFQAFDQGYLVQALEKMGASFVGVTQLPATVSDDEIIRLNKCGVRALRFNLRRGGSAGVAHLTSMARRIHELAGWHVELYIDSRELEDLYTTLVELSSVSIDHLGLSKSGLGLLTKLAETGVRIKATGFGRLDFDVRGAIRDLYAANPDSLMFGTDLPSTRAPAPYTDNDFMLVADALDPEAAKAVFSGNAIAFYKPRRVHKFLKPILG